jgi:hypothetical protein
VFGEVALRRDYFLGGLRSQYFFHYCVNIKLIVVSLAYLLGSSHTFFLYDLAFSFALFKIYQRELEWFSDSFLIRITEVFVGKFWCFQLLRDLHVQLISGGFPVTARKEHILVVDWLAFAGNLLRVLSLSIRACFA